MPDSDYCTEKIPGCAKCVKGQKRCRFCSDGLFLVVKNDKDEGSCMECNSPTHLVSKGWKNIYL